MAQNNWQEHHYLNIPQQGIHNIPQQGIYTPNPLCAPWVPPAPYYYEPSPWAPPPLSTPNWSAGVPSSVQYSPYGAPQPQQYMSHGSQPIPLENQYLEVPESQGLDPLALESSALPTDHYMNQSISYEDFKSEADRISTTHFNSSVSYGNSFVPANYNVDESSFNYQKETNESFMCSPQGVNEFYPESSKIINYASRPNNNGIVRPDDEGNYGILSAKDQSQGREYSSTFDNGISSHENAHFGENAQSLSENQNLITEKSKQEGEKEYQIFPRSEKSDKILSKNSSKPLASLSPSEIQSIWNFQTIKKPGPRAYDTYRVDVGLFYGSSRKPESRKAFVGWEQGMKSKPLVNDEYIKYYHTLYPCSVSSDIYVWDSLKPLSFRIWNFYTRNILDEKQFSSNINTTNEIQILLQKAFKNYTFLLTGSTLSGLGTKTSDVNICIMIPNVADDDIKSNKMAHLKKIKTFLRNNNKVADLQISGCTDIKLTSFPNLDISSISEKPKLHFIWWRENPVNVLCTINDTQSLSNTQLNYFYTYCDWRFQPLYCYIQTWFNEKKFSGENESLFSNYSISLLVISYLQNVFVLPTIQEHKSAKLSGNYITPIEVRNSWNYKWSSANDMTLGKLYLEFFKYYKTFDFINLKISIRSSNPVKKFDDSYIFVEDPFTQVNIIRYSNCQLELMRFINSLIEKHERLTSGVELF